MIPSSDAIASKPSQPPCWWQWKQGSLIPVDGVPLSDRGFRYGMHLFESTRLESGLALLLDAHLEEMNRRAASLEFLGILPTHSQTLEWIRNAGLADGVLRIYWTAGDGAPGEGPAEGRIYFTWEAKPLFDAIAYEKGFSVLLSPKLGAENPALHGMKTGNYWGSVLALRSAKDRNLDEMLFCDPSGALQTFATGNLLIHHEGKWWTPPERSGFRTGTVRGWFLKKGLVFEACPHLDLQDPDLELAHVNSFHGVMPVTKIITDGNSDGITLKRVNAMTLHHLFEKEVRGEP